MDPNNIKNMVKINYNNNLDEPLFIWSCDNTEFDINWKWIEGLKCC